jgi:hypothetical protein
MPVWQKAEWFAQWRAAADVEKELPRRQLEIRFYGPEIEKEFCVWRLARTPLVILVRVYAGQTERITLLGLWVSPACHIQRRVNWEPTYIQMTLGVAHLQHLDQRQPLCAREMCTIRAMCLFSPNVNTPNTMPHIIEQSRSNRQVNGSAAICYFSSTIAERWVDFSF